MERFNVTPVKDQADFGTCWVFAAVSCFETSALLKGAPNNIDLSEKALAWYYYELQNSEASRSDLREGLTNIGFTKSWFYDLLSLTYTSGASFGTISS